MLNSVFFYPGLRSPRLELTFRPLCRSLWLHPATLHQGWRCPRLALGLLQILSPTVTGCPPSVAGWRCPRLSLSGLLLSRALHLMLLCTGPGISHQVVSSILSVLLLGPPLTLVLRLLLFGLCGPATSEVRCSVDLCTNLSVCILSAAPPCVLLP